MINYRITGFTFLLLTTLLFAQSADSLNSQNVTNVATDSLNSQNVTNVATDSLNSQNVTNVATDSLNSQNETNVATDSLNSQNVTTVATDSSKKQDEPKVAIDASKEQQQSSTMLSGEIHGFLTKDKSPYTVTQSISVPVGRVLIIEPGVEIRFETGASFSIDQGQLIAGGTKSSPIIFKGIESSTVWNGISITGPKKSDLRFVEISGAKTGVVLQQGSLTIQDTKIADASERGLFAIQSNLKMIHCFFKNNPIGVHLASKSEAYLERILFKENIIGLYSSPESNTQIVSSIWKENRFALLYMKNSQLTLHRSSIENNEVGICSNEMLRPETREQVKNNKMDFQSKADFLATKIPLPPELKLSLEDEPKTEIPAISQAKDSTNWTMVGNVSAGINYRYVYTRRNHGKLNEVINQDTIGVKERYPNLWEIPGIGFDASVYLLLKNNNNQSLELSTDFYSDSWNRFNLDHFSLEYSDNYNVLTLGDFNLSLGETYLEVLSAFSAHYTLSLLRKKENHPLFTFSGFWGEAQKPFITDTRNPDIYKDWIDEGEAKAQRLVWGGDFKWDPLRRFNANFGVLFSDDKIDDPLLRDGDRATTITADPLQSAMSVYAEGNWLFFPGDIELNGQIALGRADTSDVIAQRAINQVFQDAGLSTSSYATLREIMQNSNLIQSLSRDEMIQIFGDYTSLTNSEMRDSLSSLIQEAKKVRDDFEKETNDSRTIGLDVTSQNVAIGASLFWNIKKTTLFGHINYVGENYYSPGSPSQLADVREFGGYLKQEVSPKWTFKFSYELDVENAANDTALNIFGLSEGTRLGLFEEPDSLYLKEHELDIDRTKYLHDLGIENTFTLNKNTNVFFNFQFEYQTQHRPYRLRALYDAESGIFNDSWVAPIRNRDTTTLVYNRDTILVDSARWSRYQDLTKEPFIASDFEEHLFELTFDLGFSYAFWNSEFRIDGIWKGRLDGSEFKNDSMIQKIDLSTENWGKMGYYFYGNNYFEQKYPMSIQTNHPKYINRLTFTPRYKYYERDNLKERELSLSNKFEVPLFSKFLSLALSVEMKTFKRSWVEADYMLQDTLSQEKFHYYRLEDSRIVATNKPNPTDNEVSSQLQKLENCYELISDDKEKEERENDYIVEISAKMNHSKQISSEWICRGEFFDRPNQLSNEYKNLYFGFNFNYSF